LKPPRSGEPFARLPGNGPKETEWSAGWISRIITPGMADDMLRRGSDRFFVEEPDEIVVVTVITYYF